MITRFSIVGEVAALFGALCGVVAVIIYGSVNQYHINQEFNYNTFLLGLKTTFYDSYDWPPFMIALLVPLCGTLLYTVVERFVYHHLGKPLNYTREFNDSNELGDTSCISS